MVVSDSKSLFRSILNIWGKPAENFALLTNRGLNSSWGGLAPSRENGRSLCSKVLG
jgi:hypothetical protein